MNPIESVSLFTLEDKNQEPSLDFHPKSFDEYLGQKELKEKLYIYTKAALMRNEPLDHMLLFGPPGLGKTTLAGVIATAMGAQIRTTSGPAIERAGDNGLPARGSGHSPRFGTP